MISLRLDRSQINTIVKALKNKNQQLIRAGERGLKLGMHEWIGQIQKTQMTGRPGLNVITGTLRRANRVIDRWEKGDEELVVSAQFGFPNAPYVLVHQFGTKFIPKRLYITEDFKDNGNTLVGWRATREITKEFAKSPNAF